MRAIAKLPELPHDLVNHPHRLLDTSQSCKFVGTSPRQWARLKKEGKTPPPVKINSKKEAYRLGDLISLIDARTRGPTAV
jgi:predicted DNA-binding transcriptional regulator AlpA